MPDTKSAADPGYLSGMSGEMTRTGRDVEFDVDWDFEPPDLRPLVERPQRMPEQLHHTTYYDTVDLRLWARGLILEHCRMADSEVGRWTLRSPGTESPADVSLQWTGEIGRLPGEASRILLGTVRRSELRVVAEYDTTRRRLRLAADAGDEPWGEIDDDLIAVRGGSNDGLRLRRISVVLQSGYPDAADSVLRCLRDSGATLADRPQLAFGLPRSIQRHRSNKPRTDRRDITVGDTIKGSIWAALNRLLDHDYRVRIDFGQARPHDVHQMRVAARRLRSDLRTFGSSLDPVWLGHTVADLRWLGDVLGRVRDCDIMTARFDGELDQFGLEGRRPDDLVKRLTEQRRTETEYLEATMSSERYINLLDRLHAAARGPLPAAFDTSAPSVEVLPALVRKRWARIATPCEAGRGPAN